MLPIIEYLDVVENASFSQGARYIVMEMKAKSP